LKMLRPLTFLISAVILGAGCGPSGGSSRGGTGDGSGVDPGGDLPSLSPDRFGAALSDAEVDATYQAIAARLDSLRASLPDSRAERAILLASELRQIPNVLFTHVSGDHNVTVQLRNGTPYLILTARRPQGRAAPIESSPTPASEVVSPDQPSGLSSSEQALSGSCNGMSPADGDEELPSGDQALLIDVQSLGGEAPAAIQAALENKHYAVTTSLGSLADLRSKVKDIDVFWIGTHGGISDLNIGPQPTSPIISVFGLMTGEPIVIPCSASPDCAINRADKAALRIFPAKYAEGGPPYWAITRQFVRDYHWQFHQQSIAYLDGCSTGSSSSPAQRLREDLKRAMAGGVLGWDEESSVGGAAQVAAMFFDGVAGANLYKPATPKRRPFNAAHIYQWLKDTGRDVDSLGQAHLIYEQYSAQPLALAPSIKWMQMDEDQRKLHLFGDFGSVMGMVSIAQQSYTPTSWTAHEVVVEIGSTASGVVVAKLRGHESNRAPLSNWQGTIQETWTGSDTFGPPGPTYTASCSRLHFRADAHAYRCKPGDLVVRGDAGDGIVVVRDAVPDTQCTWTTAGEGTRNQTRTIFRPPNTGQLPWYPNSRHPTQPWVFFMGRIDTGNASVITSARMTFILNYVSYFNLRQIDLITGAIYDTQSFPLFNAGTPTLSSWYPIDPTLAFPARTGIPVRGVTDHDTRTLDFNVPISGRETADTES